MKISSFPLSILPVGNNYRVVQIFFTLNSTMKICTLKHVYRYHCSFFLFMSFCAQTVPGTQRYIMKTKVHSMKKISFCPLPLLPVWAIACSIGFSRVRGGYWWVSDIASFLCVYKNVCFHVLCYYVLSLQTLSCLDAQMPNVFRNPDSKVQ